MISHIAKPGLCITALECGPGHSKKLTSRRSRERMSVSKFSPRGRPAGHVVGIIPTPQPCLPSQRSSIRPQLLSPVSLAALPSAPGGASPSSVITSTPRSFVTPVPFPRPDPPLTPPKPSPRAAVPRPPPSPNDCPLPYDPSPPAAADAAADVGAAPVARLRCSSCTTSATARRAASFSCRCLALSIDCR
jgi:hypothetical protein